MSAGYVIHVPKSTETYSVGENESKALERAKNFRGEDDYDVITLFRVEGDIQIPIAFFWNGQKFIPQNQQMNCCKRNLIQPLICFHAKIL